jgi:hypothetical protein
MSINNTYECTELNRISKDLYYADSKTPSCVQLSGLNTMINNSTNGGATGTVGVAGISVCPELSNINNIINSNNTNTNDNLNIFNSNLKIMEYSGSPVYILLLIAIIANIFLAIPLTPVFIAGFLYVIILVFILAVLCIYLIHMFLFQK